MRQSSTFEAGSGDEAARRAAAVQELGAARWVPSAPLARLPQTATADSRELSTNLVSVLALPTEMHEKLVEAAREVDPAAEDARVVIPFEPRSFRDFMLYEAHAIAAARGFVRRFMPGAARIVGAYESLTKRHSRCSGRTPCGTASPSTTWAIT
jgi:predicted dinucleotide-binding enzyme